MTKEQKVIVSISSCICLLDVFYELFFNIYILQTVTTNMILILCCYLAGIAISLLFYYPFFKILNGKTAIWIYRSSFLMSFVIIILSMTIHASFAFTLIFINTLKSVFNLCFYVPQEVATMKHVKKDSSSGFLATKIMCNTTARVVFSLAVSALFTYFDTIWLFVIMLADVAIMFVLSFGMKTTGTDFEFRPKAYYNETKEYPHMKYIYISHGFKRISEAGVVQTLIPIMLFMSIGSEFSLGIYSSIACVISACWLPVFARLKKIQTPLLFTMLSVLIVSSILLVVWVHPVTYVAYYLINQFASNSYSNSENASLFDSIKYPLLSTNKEEHAYFYSFVGRFFELISYALGILVYAIAPVTYSIPIIIIFCMSMKMVSLIVLKKADKITQNLKDKAIMEI